MMYCEHCDMDILGGSICHVCGSTLVPKQEDQRPKVTHISSDIVMGGKKGLSVSSAQSLSGRLFRLVLEIALFCAIFYFLSLGIAHTINWLSREMAVNPEPDAIDLTGKPFRYFQLFGIVIVGLLTIKFRFQSGK